MTEVSWSRVGDEECVRLGRLAADSEVHVHVRPPPGVALDALPPMAGRLVGDGDDLCFVPRFAFVGGTTYIVRVEGVARAVLERARPERPATTEVLDIHPTASEVPRNLLRFYVWFSAPMREGCAATHIRLVDEAGDEMVGALLPTEHELWDLDRRRLTVLLDPARIKRGLVAHRQRDYPLRAGATFRLVVDEQFCDAFGAHLCAGAERAYEVGGDERRRVEPERWRLTVPSSGTSEPLDVVFDRPLDHGLLARGLHVVGPDRRRVDGTRMVGAGERSWRLAPSEPWAPGSYHLVVDPVLEDLAGNSVSRVFDRDLTRPEDAPREPRATALTFSPQ